ncbi:MAG: hypothetical protein WDN24_11895 [Sphingomonas sp.]
MAGQATRRVASYFPFCAHSPELVALQRLRRRGCTPASSTCRRRRARCCSTIAASRRARC